MHGVVPIALVATLAACAPRPDPALVWEGAGAARVESTSSAVLRLEPASPGVRRGAWGEADDATVQLMETARAEKLHVHAHHDLTIVLLQGGGTVVVEGRRHRLRAGDVLQIGRGRVHALQPDGPVVGLAIFTPRLTVPDYVPASAVRNDGATAP